MKCKWYTKRSSNAKGVAQMEQKKMLQMIAQETNVQAKQAQTVIEL